jgi:hypothetical protein
MSHHLYTLTARDFVEYLAYQYPLFATLTPYGRSRWWSERRLRVAPK